MNISQNPQYDFLKIIGVIVVFAGVATFASLSMRSNPLEQTGLVIDQKTTAVTVLKVGTKDAEVQKLEQFLKDKKYFAGIPDTTFGRETEYAVKKFQTAYQIKPTGTFGGKWDPADPSRMPPPSNYTPTVCDADFNHDGWVSVADLLIFLQSFGDVGSNIPEDLDHSGVVGVSDLLYFIGFYGQEANCSLGFMEVTTGNYYHTCAISNSHKAYCWGQSTGQLGSNVPINSDQFLPIAVDTSALGIQNSFNHITAGQQYTCGLHTNGKIYCWGQNGPFGSLGNGSNSMSSVPVAVNVTDLEISNSFVKLDAGNYHTCAIHTSGKIYCWGQNGPWGALGNGGGAAQSTPVEINVSGLGISNSFTEVSAGNAATCAIHTNGKIYCWGENSWGELGIGNIIDQPFPVEVSMGSLGIPNSFTKISMNARTTCAIHTNAKSYCWGANDAGQAGNNNFTNLTLPVEVGYDFTGGNEFINIATGGRHTCGVRADGNTYCWGENTFGQLGNGTTANQYLPTGITEPSIYPASEKFALSAYHTCLINQQNQLFCWGSNQDGLLGNGTEINSYVPVPVDMTNVE